MRLFEVNIVSLWDFMRKVIIISAVGILVLVITLLCIGSCSNRRGDEGVRTKKSEIIAKVDGATLTREQLTQDTPNGLSGTDSVTFCRMYIENWVIKQLKISRAKEVLKTSESEIERLVEDYRQSLIMRNLDQYYIDHSIDLEISQKQIITHYRANAASFKLDHNKVRGVVVKVPKSFRNTSSLNTALKSAAKGDVSELAALVEKHSLQLTDMSDSWIPYADFLSHLPTERSTSYDKYLSKKGVAQQMSGDNATFHFVIIDVARKGSTAPIESVEEDIKRMLYANRRQEIVHRYEEELRQAAAKTGRIHIADTALMRVMTYVTPTVAEQMPSLRDIADETLQRDTVSNTTQIE